MQKLNLPETINFDQFVRMYCSSGCFSSTVPATILGVAEYVHELSIKQDETEGDPHVALSVAKAQLQDAEKRIKEAHFLEADIRQRYQQSEVLLRDSRAEVLTLRNGLEQLSHLEKLLAEREATVREVTAKLEEMTEHASYLEAAAGNHDAEAIECLAAVLADTQAQLREKETQLSELRQRSRLEATSEERPEARFRSPSGHDMSVLETQAVKLELEAKDSTISALEGIQRLNA